MVCSGSVLGTFDILFDGIWHKWNRYACSSKSSGSGEIIIDFETVAHTYSARIFTTGYTWHGHNDVSQKLYYSTDGINWIYLQDLFSSSYPNHGKEYTVTINDNLRYVKTTFTISDDWIGLSEVERRVTIADTTPPTITLTGTNPQIIELGTGYTELGATTNDGSPVIIDSSSFIDSIGSYFITYNSADSSGNNAIQITRTVNVFQEIEFYYLVKNDLFYNYTRSSYNSTTDKIIFTANKQQDTFSLLCNHFTLSSTDEWNNQTSIISYNAEFLTKHTSYIRCYDETQNIILLQTVYKPYGITSGFDMINESFGNDGLFGVPFPFLIVLIVASIWTGRNAQVGVIVTGAIIGIMGLLGLFELSAEVWAMIVLLVAVGMFLGKKVF